MRKKSLIIFLSVILVLSPVASAGFFDWFTGMFAISEEVKPATTEGQQSSTVYEQVTCVFTGSTSEQTCVAPDVQQSCTGTERCTMSIYGAQGLQVYIKACTGSDYATIDSSDETKYFKCEQPAEKVSEQVECVFTNTDTSQKCYSSPGAYSCEGTKSCIMTVNGEKGITSFTWKSSCGGGEYAVVDGTNKRFEFDCGTSVEQVKEEVKCVFKGATSEQKCYADNGQSCGAIYSCTFPIIGAKGRQVTWKSSCGGYAYTVMDGNTETIEFNCEQQSTTTTPVFEPIKETIVCVFRNYKGEQTCMTDDKKFVCSAREGKCAVSVYSESGVYGSSLAWYSTCGGKAITILDRVDETITFDCGQANEVPAIPATPAETVKEQVKCVFLESKQQQKCYSEYGQTCEGETSCVIDIIGEKGRKTALKSTCGGYAYIVIDGNNENAQFKCIPREEVAPEQIIGRGFQRAAWECYDGTKSVSQEVGCLPSEVWNKKAEEFCNNHCYQDNSKCGVNSFSVSEECYEAIAQTQLVELEKVKEEMNKRLEQDSLAYIYTNTCSHCEGMGEEVDKAAKELEIPVSKIDKDQGASNMGMVPYYFVYVNAVPLLLFAKGEKEEGFKIYTRPGKADAQTIIQWVKDIYAGNVKPQEITDVEKLREDMEGSKEETLFCKDSCPLDGKCYPFGYRKKGMFCSDEGMFKEQLVAEEVCDNNFECSSNVCIDSKCVSAGAIRKFFEWFKGIFG
ncbi:MAG: hypothetical protein Q8O03_00470 [Nanoarchaeota archaeon]|nr:hypothetical protein [Nanoarchaeota archaeon]